MSAGSAAGGATLESTETGAWRAVRSAALEPAAVAQPHVTSTSPAAGAVNVARDAFVAADVVVPNGGIDPASLTPTSVFLQRSDGLPVPAVLNTSGGGDVIVLRPEAPLDANTSYVFQVTDGVKDITGVAFEPYTMSFTTGVKLDGADASVRFEKVALPSTAAKQFTAVAMGPDDKLYAATIQGRILRWTLNADGTLGASQTIESLRTANGSADRFLVGLEFDPASTASNPILWVSHSAYSFADGPDWTGKISRLSDDSGGADLAKVEDRVINLPRSSRDHVTNQLRFGPVESDGKRHLYFNQGANSAMGAADAAWDNRPERLLNAAILRLNVSALGSGPLDAHTADATPYNPFAAGAPLTIFATGVRNAYDLVWHSNGQLYAPTNGSSSGGATPATPNPFAPPYSPRIDEAVNGPYTTPEVPAIAEVTETQNDFLFRAVKGGYYGHPNPARHEYVMNGGNPTSGSDNAQVSQYPVGTQPDRNWRGSAFDFGAHVSPNGAIEYRNGAFGGALLGKLLVVRYSGPDDIMTLTPGVAGNITASSTGITGFSGFDNPLDLVEDTDNGFLYVAEYGGEKITLLRPSSAVYSSQDVSATPAGATAVIEEGSAYDVTAGGSNIAGTADSFRYVYEQRTGDFDAQVQIPAFQQTSTAAKAGLMARESLAVGSRNVFANLTPAEGFRHSYRSATNGATTIVPAGTVSFPNAWVRLKRAGNVFTSYRSTDGINWTSLGSTTLSLPSTLLFGMAVAAKSSTVTSVAQFRNLSFAGPAVAATPLNLQATPASSAQVDLSWTASAGASLYRIQRKAPGQSAFVDFATTTATSFSDTSVTAENTYSYQVRAENSAGASAYTAPVSATTLAAGTAFTSADVNATPAGSTTLVTEGVAYDVTAGGPNISGTADGFRFLHRQQTGDFDVKVKVQSLTAAHPTSKAGLMARESLGAGSRNVFVNASASDGYRLSHRSSTGGTTTILKAGTVAYPNAWVRLRRVGNVFTAFHGTDGGAWTQTGQVTMTLPSTVYFGMAASSAAATTTTAQFRAFGEVTAAPAPAPATPTGVSATAAAANRVDVAWAASAGATLYRVQRKGSGESTFTDLGTATGTSYTDTTVAASSTYSYQVRAENGSGNSSYSSPVSATTPAPAPVGSTFTSADIAATPAGNTTVVTEAVAYDVTAGGPNIAGTVDGFRFLHQQRTGDFDAKVRVNSLTAADPTTKAGLMARETLAANSRNVFSTATAGDTFRLSHRSSTGGSTSHIKLGTPAFPNAWVRLKRAGNVFTAYHSVNGEAWTQTGQVTMTLPSTVFFGMAASSAAETDPTATTTAQFRDFANVVPSITWSTVARNPLVRAEAQGTAVNGKLYVAGGFTDTTFIPKSLCEKRKIPCDAGVLPPFCLEETRARRPRHKFSHTL